MFGKAIERAEPADDVKTRVLNLIDCITFSVFTYTSRGLFEKDKLIFVSQMCFTVSIAATQIYHNIVLYQQSREYNYTILQFIISNKILLDSPIRSCLLPNKTRL